MKKLNPPIALVVFLLACGSPPGRHSGAAARARPRFDSLKSSSYVHPLADGRTC